MSRRRRPFVGLAVAAAMIPASPLVAAEPTLATDEQKILYVLGIEVARNLKQFNLSESDLAAVQAGLADGTLGRSPKVPIETYGPRLEGFARERTRVAYTAETAASDAYLAAEAAKVGVRKLDSGVLYTELQAGTGPSPKPTDTVTVQYHGTLRDGRVFDSSVARGKPATFALNGVIKCWTEGVTLMKVGGRSRLVCPAATAYGERGMGGVPAGAALTFDIELLSIAAAPAGQ